MEANNLKKNIIILAVIMGLSIVAYYEFSIPKSYGDCLDDGKTGRTGEELAIKAAVCRKQFPALPNLAKGKQSIVKCYQASGSNTMQLYFGKDDISFNGLRFNYEIRTPDLIIFSGKDFESDNNKKFSVNGQLNLNSGELNYRENVEGAVYPRKWEMTCTQFE